MVCLVCCAAAVRRQLATCLPVCCCGGSSSGTLAADGGPGTTRVQVSAQAGGGVRCTLLVLCCCTLLEAAGYSTAVVRERCDGDDARLSCVPGCCCVKRAGACCCCWCCCWCWQGRCDTSWEASAKAAADESRREVSAGRLQTALSKSTRSGESAFSVSLRHEDWRAQGQHRAGICSSRGWGTGNAVWLARFAGWNAADRRSAPAAAGQQGSV